MTEYKKKVDTPLTADQLKEKLKSKGLKIVLPKKASTLKRVPRVSQEDVFVGKAPFGHVALTAVGNSLDQVGVDGNGTEHKFPGGMWVDFNWSVSGFGFGELRLKVLMNGTLEVHSEGLGKDFVKAMLCDLVDRAELKK